MLDAALDSHVLYVSTRKCLPEDDPVDDRMDERVSGRTFVEGCYMVEHAVGDHLLPFRN